MLRDSALSYHPMRFEIKQPSFSAQISPLVQLNLVLKSEFLHINLITIQGVIATLKAIYKKVTFQKAHETHKTLAEFLKDYDILDAVYNLGNAWRQITKKNMRSVWNPLLKVNKSEKSFFSHFLKKQNRKTHSQKDLSSHKP